MLFRSMRIADMALSLPFLPFVIVLIGFLGASTANVVLAVVLLLWPNSARVIRSQVLTLRERAYVEAARVTGASAWRILTTSCFKLSMSSGRSVCSTTRTLYC